MIGEAYKYLGGDSFLDSHLIKGNLYTISNISEVDGNDFVTFLETDRASYIYTLEKTLKISLKKENLN